MNDDILLIDKQAGWTSFDVVAKIRGVVRKKYQDQGVKPTKRQLRVGHAGTLDPFATGLLIVLLGDATKRADEFLKLDKVYEATIALGATSTTGDPEGEILPYGTSPSAVSSEHSLRETSPARGVRLTGQAPDTVSSDTTIEPAPPSLERVQHALAQFVGEIQQRPPAHSAIKINGKRAYKLAREGKAVDMPLRNVTIHSIELVSYAYPELTIRTHVSSGTYIRSLAQDIGEVLATGAYCSQLRRTKIAQWDVTDAKNVNNIDL